jgi:nucleoside-diphosphate-sugar epimerase
MDPLPDRIENEEELEDLLARPSEADCDALRAAQGDVLVLGAGGKMGPSLAKRARQAADKAGIRIRVMAVSRFSNREAERSLCESGVETIKADLMEREDLNRLPDAENVIFMAGRKFGSTGAESLTWAMNAHLPALVAERFRHARIVAFSSGNIYPLVPVSSGGSTEDSPTGPIGEYAESVLARERLFEHFSERHSTRVALLRLNYALDLRYGVLLDIGTKVYGRIPVDLRMGAANVIWQGDANSVCLRSFPLCQSPPYVLNVTGPETMSVRYAATQFGERFGIEPLFEGTESPSALLNNAGRCHKLFGYPSVSLLQLLDWTAHWIRIGGPTLNKPTHFETRDGQF